jgi:hypothetical protein
MTCDAGEGNLTMAGNIVKIETAMISRLPQTMGEIWEVGRRPLDISIVELERKGERPELLLAVQAGGRGGAILANLIPSSAPPATLADFVLQAMRQPMIGKPRRPQVIRVSSQAEAETLAATLSAVGVRLEVASELTVLDTLQAEMTAALGIGALSLSGRLGWRVYEGKGPGGDLARFLKAPGGATLRLYL